MYKQAIGYLMEEEIDFRAVCIQIAKSNPSTFVKAYEKLYGNYDEMCKNAHKNLHIEIDRFRPMYASCGNEDWFKEVMDFLFEDENVREKIKAIKLYRHASGMGLKDSKEFIEVILDMSGISWRVSPW